MSNLPERHHNLHTVKQGKFSFEEWPARADLFPARLVARRSAVAGGSDVCIVQREPIVNGAAARLARKSGLMEHAVQYVPTRIAREHPAGSIGSVSARRESQDQYPRAWISKGRNRPAP